MKILWWDKVSADGQSPENRTEWQEFLKTLDQEEGSDILFQFVRCKGYEASVIWKKSIYCRQHDFDFDLW